MKKLITGLALFIGVQSIAQEPQIITFEDGTKIEFILYHDTPDELPEWTLGVNMGSIFLQDYGGATTLTLTPTYRISNALEFDGSLNFGLGYADGFRNGLDEDFVSAGKGALEIAANVHYKLTSNVKTKEKPLQIGYERTSSDAAISYVHRVPLSTHRSLNVDGGINFLRYSINTPFDRIGDATYYLVSQGAFSFTGGLSYSKSYNFKYKKEKGDRLGMRQTRWSLQLLAGVPASSSIVKHTKIQNDLGGTVYQTELNPTSYDQAPTFKNFGARLNYDGMRTFARAESLFLTLGGSIGLMPSYVGNIVSLSTTNPSGSYESMSQSIYYNLRFGIGFNSKNRK